MGTLQKQLPERSTLNFDPVTLNTMSLLSLNLSFPESVYHIISIRMCLSPKLILLSPLHPATNDCTEGYKGERRCVQFWIKG